MTSPNPTNNPYGPQLVKLNPPALSSKSSVPAPVSTLRPADVIAANMKSAIMQNNLVSAGNGRVVGGGSKRKRSHKWSHKRSHKRSYKNKRSHKRFRNKRGGNANPNPTTRPTTSVPQFGPLHAGANSASVNLNGGAMLQTSQAKYDDTKAAPSSFHFQ